MAVTAAAVGVGNGGVGEDVGEGGGEGGDPREGNGGGGGCGGGGGGGDEAGVAQDAAVQGPAGASCARQGWGKGERARDLWGDPYTRDRADEERERE